MGKNKTLKKFLNTKFTTFILCPCIEWLVCFLSVHRYSIPVVIVSIRIQWQSLLRREASSLSVVCIGKPGIYQSPWMQPWHPCSLGCRQVGSAWEWPQCRRQTQPYLLPGIFLNHYVCTESQVSPKRSHSSEVGDKCWESLCSSTWRLHCHDNEQVENEITKALAKITKFPKKTMIISTFVVSLQASFSRGARS